MKSPRSRENDSVILGAEAAKRRIHFMETLDVASSDWGESGGSLEDLNGCLLLIARMSAFACSVKAIRLAILVVFVRR